jgi:membrane-bound serine protease (ClpP class)
MIIPMSLRRSFSLIAVIVAAAGLWLAASGSAQDSGLAVSVEVDGTIDPASERWIASALEDAADDGAELVVIRLDTPGGLDSSTREIVQDIIAAPMPVVVHVAPEGARAASAGLFVTQAADVAAMAPQTNIGSASPITIGPGEADEVLGRKIENDAAAYVRALAEVHGRNPDLAEEMVRDAVNVTATEALADDLIDAVADEASLLAELDGFRVQGPKAGVLDTQGLRIEEREMPLQYELLQILVNPNVSYLLLLVGLIGIALEVFSPGAVIPGAGGSIALLLGLYGTAQLPVEIAGILLLVLGVGLIIAEAHLPTGGLLGVAGVAALAASGLLLYDDDAEGFGVSPPVIIALAVAIGGAGAVVIQKVRRAHERPVLTGWEELVGAEGEVRTALEPVGQVFVGGALWRARASAGQAPIGLGDRVVVESVDGLTLHVRRSGPGGAEESTERS